MSDWYPYVKFRFISYMVPHTGLTEDNVADVTVKWKNRCFTQVTTYDILSAVTWVHDFETLAISKKDVKSEEKPHKIKQCYTVWILYDILIFNIKRIECFLRLILFFITSIYIQKQLSHL